MKTYKIIVVILLFIALAAGLYIFWQFRSHDTALVIEQPGNRNEIEKLFEKEGAVDTESMEGPELIRSGEFIKVDAIHQASGDAKIYDTTEGKVLRLENFSVTDGPDLFVYLSEEVPTKQLDGLGNFISLGELQKPEGTQTYALPDDIEKYKSVVIWCRAFGVLFSSAELQ